MLCAPPSGVPQRATRHPERWVVRALRDDDPQLPATQLVTRSPLLIGRVIGQLTDWLEGWLVGWPTDWLTKRSPNQTTGWLIGRLARWPDYWLVSWLTVNQADHLTGMFTVRLTTWPDDPLSPSVHWCSKVSCVEFATSAISTMLESQNEIDQCWLHSIGFGSHHHVYLLITSLMRKFNKQPIYYPWATHF